MGQFKRSSGSPCPIKKMLIRSMESTQSLEAKRNLAKLSASRRANEKSPAPVSRAGQVGEGQRCSSCSAAKWVLRCRPGHRSAAAVACKQWSGRRRHFTHAKPGGSMEEPPLAPPPAFTPGLSASVPAIHVTPNRATLDGVLSGGYFNESDCISCRDCTGDTGGG